MSSVFDKLSSIIKGFDSDLTGLISRFMKSYTSGADVDKLFFSNHLVDFVKIIIYALFVLVLFLIGKVLFPEKRVVNWVLIGIVIVGGLAVAGIFFGFLQLLYNF